MSGVVPIPVRMFWNAVSTFVESRADVSMKDRVFFSGDRGKEREREMERWREREREGERDGGYIHEYRQTETITQSKQGRRKAS